MISMLLEDTSLKNFEEALCSLEKQASSIIILSCDNGFSPDTLDPILKELTIPIIGGIFPSIIYKNRQYNQGTILLGLDTPFEVTILRDTSQKKDYDKVIEQQTDLLKDDTKTMFLFFDGISRSVDSIVQALFNNFGLSINYVGGAAASYEHLADESYPVIFSNEGLLAHAALLATSAESTIGVRHGLEPITETIYQVTKSDGNVIHELDYKPAFAVYKEALESHFKKSYEHKIFFQQAIIYPLGVTRLVGESVIRTALENKSDNFLVCTGDIAENSMVQILHATNSKLIEAAKTASTNSHNVHYQTSFNLYFTCLARTIILGEDFKKEIATVYEEDTLLVGAVSIGEIANNQDHYLELYNATAVVANIDDTPK